MLTKQNPKAIIIAEAGINHDGDLVKAKKMIDVAAEAGADYVKFQSFNSGKLVTHDALTSSYIDEGSNEGESFRSLLARLEINENNHRELKAHCEEKKIKFMSTAFDEKSFDLLLDLGADAVKVASGDVTNLSLLRYFAKSKLPIIMSTGMCTLGEIEDAIEAIEGEGNFDIVLLHCVSWYPAEIETTNLRYMETLKSAFNYPVGYSDHTLGITMTIAARTLGAAVLEKHFTLDKNDFGPDHAASIEPDELISLVKSVREVEAGLGSSRRKFGQKEIGQRLVHRRSLVAGESMKAGTIFDKSNLVIKRPGTGIKPKYYEELLGRKLKIDVDEDTVLDWNMIE